MESSQKPVNIRHRTSLSCAECRRLKLKCDRSFPCANCIRRNCSSICPTGVLPASGRISKAAVQVTALNQRVLELEEIMRSNGLDKLIPPTSERMVASGSGIKGEEHGKPREDSSEVKPTVKHVIDGGVDLLEGIGSLTIQEEDGSTRFLGMSSGSAYFHGSDSSPSSDEEEEVLSPTSEPSIAQIVTTYPFTQSGSTYPVSLGESKFQEIEHIRSYLPAKEEGTRLAQNYWLYVSFMFEPLEEDVFWDDYFVSAYTGVGQGTKLACVFIILALGSLFDPTAPPTFNASANQYFLLSQTSLSAARFLSQNTAAAAQTIQLTGNFLFNTHKLEDGGETFFCLLSLGLRMAVTMGLHRDGSKWQIVEPELERRRLLFYELMTLDRLQSFICGRPYVLHGAAFDTLPPTKVDDYQKTKFKIAIFLGKVIDEAFSIKVPNYATILSLGQEFRDLYQASPDSLRSTTLPTTAFIVRPTGPPVLPIPPKSTDTVKVQMRRHTLDMYFAQVLLYLHKPPFAQALIHYPEEPLQSPWAASVAAVSLETGVYILALAQNWIKIDPVLCPRWWHIFFHGFAVSVVQASLVIKSPRSLLAKHAWDQLNIAVQIFEEASIDGAPVSALLPRVKTLRNNAYVSLQSILLIPGAGLSDPMIESITPVSNSRAHSPSGLSGGDSSITALGASTHISRKSKKVSSKGMQGGESNPSSHYTPSPPLSSSLPLHHQQQQQQQQQLQEGSGDHSMNSGAGAAEFIPYTYTLPQESNNFDNSFESAVARTTTGYSYNNGGDQPQHLPNLTQQQELIDRELAAQASLLQQQQQQQQQVQQQRRAPPPPLRHTPSYQQLQQQQQQPIPSPADSSASSSHSYSQTNPQPQFHHSLYPPLFPSPLISGSDPRYMPLQPPPPPITFVLQPPGWDHNFPTYTHQQQQHQQQQHQHQQHQQQQHQQQQQQQQQQHQLQGNTGQGYVQQRYPNNINGNGTGGGNGEEDWRLWNGMNQ